jgi:hypothetical protein
MRIIREMANGLEKERFGTDLVNSPGAGEPLGLHQKHRERIQNKLEEFLPAPEARDTATQVYDLALDVDEEIGRILKDPLVGRLYEYDGRFFTPRGTRLFHTAFDGLHILKSLKDSILETFFRGREKHFAMRWLMEELGKHAWVAKIRRMNWEESGTLSMVPKEVLDEIIKDIRERVAVQSRAPSFVNFEWPEYNPVRRLQTCFCRKLAGPV